MGKPLRAAEGGLIYHVLNRANARMPLFEKEGDYEAFQRVLEQAVERTGTRLLAYCVLRNHWHLVVWPREDGELSKFTGWLTLTHTQRWHAHRRSTGSGHVYQGRFKSFPVQDDGHFYTLCRYVERNALRANVVERAEDWRWGSLNRWKHGTAKEKSLLSSWPLPRRPGWIDHVNAPQTEAELSALRRCVKRGNPFGETTWCDQTVRRLGLESTLRPQGRPRKQQNGS
ncbi:MAG: transposase [Planctomycetes bacterium]|nr:transposase [Planctomycetota bacterium]